MAILAYAVFSSLSKKITKLWSVFREAEAQNYGFIQETILAREDIIGIGVKTDDASYDLSFRYEADSDKLKAVGGALAPGEMLALLKEAGIRNYTIWSDGRDVFGYYECEKGIEFAEKTQAGSPVVDKWNDYMEDVLDLVMDPETGAQPKLRMMFMME